MFMTGWISLYILRSSIFHSVLYKRAKWGNAQSAESVTIMAEEVKPCQPHVSLAKR